MNELKRFRLDFALDDTTSCDIQHPKDKTVRANADNHYIFNPTVTQKKTESGKAGTAI